MKKEYRIKMIGSKFTFPVEVNDRSTAVTLIGYGSLGDGFGYFSTENEALQAAIEETQLFKTGKVKIYGTQDDETSASENSASTPPSKKVYTEVTTLNGVVEVLSSPDYRVSRSALKNKESIRAIADAHGIGFPNVVWDEAGKNVKN
jgi:hypothetical protein